MKPPDKILAKIATRFHYNEKTGQLWRLYPKFSSIIDYVNTRGYVSLSINCRPCPAHRLIWFLYYGYWPSKLIDHINGIKKDNRICNLREATHAENVRNSKLHITNTVGYRGVYFCKGRESKPWMASIRFERKLIHIGRYATKEEASDAYDTKQKELFGEFIRKT